MQFMFYKKNENNNNNIISIWKYQHSDTLCHFSVHVLVLSNNKKMNRSQNTPTISAFCVYGKWVRYVYHLFMYDEHEKKSENKKVFAVSRIYSTLNTNLWFELYTHNSRWFTFFMLEWFQWMIGSFILWTVEGNFYAIT